MDNGKAPDTGVHAWVKDIKQEDQVKGIYLVKAKRTALTRKGDTYLSLTLGDRTGDVEARVWERAREFSGLFKEGEVIYVEGYANSYRDQVQITISTVEIPKGAVEPDLFLERSANDPNEMSRALREVLKPIGQPALRTMVDKFLSDTRFMSRFRESPAAKSFHHNYLGGLLEHTLSVCRMCRSVADHYRELDRDLLLAGAFLHDIGKTREMSWGYQIDYTDEGRLLGHIVLGVTMLEEKLEGIKRFPGELKLRLKHLILSHHGHFEFGSPKRPKFLEAYALHLVDDLDAKLNGLGRFMERDQKEGAWTEFNRLFERYFLKGSVPEAEEEEAPRARREDNRQKALFEG
ncbi:MAG: HD domain-containing protein [Deltaproteobacteria bacterium]|nr:HD domain-containing protein [Deltaproteobacteria bacterium]MBW2136709.1 HD domain-containing protein [Deltaproteobacteria bacterium]